MKVITKLLRSSFTLLMFMAQSASCQELIVPSDSANKTLDVQGWFNGATIHLPEAGSRPEFEGGKQSWHAFLKKNIDITVPFSNRIKPGEYSVIIRFIIDPTGKIRDVGALTNCGYGLEAEVIRCIRNSPDWIPAVTTSGKKVQFTVRTMVNFTVKPNDIEISF